MICPNCKAPDAHLYTTAPRGPSDPGVTHCGCFWEGDAEGKGAHSSTTPAHEHRYMRGEPEPMFECGGTGPACTGRLGAP